jgi:DNA-binding CsgD family transcriptional regulator
MLDIGQFISDTNSAKDSDEAFTYLEKYLGQLGFDRVVYSLLTDHPNLNKNREHGIVRNYPEDWMNYYFSKGYVDVDPTIKIMKQRQGAFAWTSLAEIKNVTKQEQLLMDEAKEAKLLEGIGLALHGPNGQIVGMGVASSAGGTELQRDTVSMVYLLCTQFNQIYQSLEQEKSIAPVIIDLSEREKEILTWLAVGKSKSVVGDILSISEHTVKTYLKRAFTKLGVHTKQEAIVHAIRLGLITPALSSIKPGNVTH